mgnify:CR=1 FL=1
MQKLISTVWAERRAHAARLIALVRREIGLILLLAVAAACLWAFAGIADEVLEQETHGFDMAVLEALRAAGPGDPIGPEWLEDYARDFTSLGGVPILALMAIVCAAYLTLTRRRATAAYLVGALTGGSLISAGLKDLFDRTRPDAVFQATPVYSASFPSGHAFLSAVAYLTLGALLARVQERRRAKIFVLSVAVFLALLVGFTRIYLGVHWATDVLAGWTLGAAWAALCWTGLLLMQRRAGQRPEQEADAAE